MDRSQSQIKSIEAPRCAGIGRAGLSRGRAGSRERRLPFDLTVLLSIFVALGTLVEGTQQAFAESAREKNGKQLAKPKDGSEKESVATAGLFLGYVVEVDSQGRFIFVRPLEGNGSRRTFYLDRKTLYRKDRKPVQREELAPGRRIGIRYVKEEELAYAEGIFLIVGEEIKPRDFEMPRKKPKPKPEGKAAGGEHGAKPAGKDVKPAAKKPEKKGGGH